MRCSCIRPFLSVTFLLAFGIAAFGSPVSFLPLYIPSDPEISTLFNLHAYLQQYNNDPSRAVEEAKLAPLIDLSQKYNILQTYALEAFLQNTSNRNVTDFYRRYTAAHLLTSQSVSTTLSLIDRPPAPQKTTGQSPTFLLPNGKSAEWIDLFALTEITLFDRRLHSMIFGNNSWSQLASNGDPNTIMFNCGGGTNAFSMVYKRLPMSSDDFVIKEVNSDFYRKKYENWNISKLSASGVLARAGANAIYFGQGATLGLMGIKESTATLFFYSQKYAEGYELTWLMNFSSSNSFYDEPERAWHYLAETLLLSWVE